MKRLFEVGFRKAGEWGIDDQGNPCAKLVRFSNSNNILYCHAINDQCVYLAKAKDILIRSLTDPTHPDSGTPALIKNHHNILSAINKGAKVEIYVLPDSGLMKYGDFTINIASALEDSIIKIVQPPWNIADESNPK